MLYRAVAVSLSVQAATGMDFSHRNNFWFSAQRKHNQRLRSARLLFSERMERLTRQCRVSTRHQDLRWFRTSIVFTSSIKTCLFVSSAFMLTSALHRWHVFIQLVFFSFFLLSSGNIIGSGIFISPKGVLEHSGSVGLALVVWVLGGCIAALGSLCYAELGVTIPKSGGDYSYVTEIFGGLMGWVSSLLVWMREDLCQKWGFNCQSRIHLRIICKMSKSCEKYNSSKWNFHNVSFVQPTFQI